MSYDLFISYARRDNDAGQVASLVAQIRDDFRAFAGRDLQVFFDTQVILGMDDWRQKIQQSLRQSQLFLAVLSPSYLASSFCRWEWDDYVRYEAMRQCLGEGVAPVFFVSLPGVGDPATDPALTGWIEEIKRRQIFDLQPWSTAGQRALEDAHVHHTLAELHAAVRERLDRSARARRSPTNLLRHNPWFVGRVQELSELRRALARNVLGVVGASGGRGVTAVQGLGGMGKTELALAYAHAFAWDYPGGRWQVACDRVGDLRLALRQLAGPMGFDFTEDENKDIDRTFERVLRELGRRERSLLLLDNVSEPGLLEPAWLDRLPRDGHVDLIATTRLAPAHIPGSAQDQVFIAVDELPEDDALALLRGHQPDGRFPSQAEDDEARAIARLLEGFTLAVETAAIYLGRHTAPNACRRFRERLAASLLDESESAAGDTTVSVRHRERLLEKTLAFTLERLKPEEMHLLTLGALLPADAIALPWLAAVGAERFAELAHDGEEPSEVFLRAVERLVGTRLFSEAGATDGGGRPRLVTMHRLVQEIVRRGSGDIASRERSLFQHARTRAVFTRHHWLALEHRWELDPLAACAWPWMALHGVEGCELVGELGKPLLALGRYAEAEPLMRRALAIGETIYGPDHPGVVRDLNNLAALLQATNRLAEAEPLMRRALAIDETNNGPEHRATAIALNNLAQVLLASNRLTEAEQLMRRALAIFESSGGPEHSNVADSLNNLAELLKTTNRLAAAEPLMRRTLAIDQARYGLVHPSVARDLNNLAQLLLETNRLAEAEPLMRRALAIDEATYGPDHPDVARDLNNLAGLLKAMNRLAEAEPLMRRTLEVYEKRLGPEHTSVAVALSNLAMLLLEANRPREAEPLMRRALVIDETSYGLNHPIVATRLGNLSGLLQTTGRLAEAEPLVRRALAINEASFGPDHPGVARDLNNLGDLLLLSGRLAEAEPLLRRSLAIFQASCGPDHPRVAVALTNLAQLLQATSHIAEAEQLMRSALVIDEKNYGLQHPRVAARLNSLAQLLQDTSRMAEAEPLMRRALAIDEASFGSEHPNVAVRLNNLAQLIQATNSPAEAEPLMRRALAIDEASHGLEHPQVARDLSHLAALLYATSRWAEAEPLMRRALAIDEASCGRHHPSVARDLSNLAALLQATNRRAEAEPLIRHALAIDEASYGPHHPNVAIRLNNLAQLLQDANRLAEAEQLMRRGLLILLDLSRTAGHQHPSLRTAMHNYAELLTESGSDRDQIVRVLDDLLRPFGLSIA